MFNIKKILGRIFRFGFMKRLMPGAKILIYPSFGCNYNCSYCSTKTGEQVAYMPKSLMFWKDKLEDFDTALDSAGGIREIVISGGEPTMLPFFIRFLNWLLHEKKWYVTLITNLSNLKLAEIKPSIRLRVVATFHSECVIPADYKLRYDMLSKIHRIDSQELETDKFEFTKVRKEILDCDYIESTKIIRIAPDGSIYLTREEAIEFNK